METVHLSTELFGERVTLRKHSEGLAEQMFDYINKDRQRLEKFLPWVPTIKSVNDELNYIKMTHAKWEQGTLYDFGIFLTEGNIYMGNIGVHTINWEHHHAEIGYWILGDFEGKGHISESVLLLEEHLFKTGFHRIEIRCSDLNERSSNVPERCGYTYEGTARENLLTEGKYRNTKIFSKLSSD